MQETSSRTKSTCKLERFLAVLGTTVCLVISAGIWQALRTLQPLWPFPDLYLLEMLAASSLVMWGIWSNGSGQGSLRGILTWAGIGIILGFVILGVFSIGFFYIPVAGLLAGAAILSDRRQGHNLIVYLGMGMAAALAQAALMLAVIRVLYR
jgi:hypothetical protein